MSAESSTRPRHAASKAVPLIVLLATFAVLGGIIALGTIRLRDKIRAQQLHRDGDVFHAVALAHPFSAPGASQLGERLRDPAGQLALALDISTLSEGVLAVRLFDARGRFVTAFPPYVPEAQLAAADIAALVRLEPVCRFELAAPLSEVSWLVQAGAGQGTPLLLVTIPVHGRGEATLQAGAQLVLDGRPLANAFADLDRHLAVQATLAFLAGGLVLVAALAWAYRRLRRSNALLEERTARLLRANHELTLAAKTSAVGAVTAHLVHGLSNPLANLQHFVSCRGSELGDDLAWQEALSTARRAQRLVDETVRVLSEETAAQHYEVAVNEFGLLLSDRLQPVAQDFGVRLEIDSAAPGVLSNRDANLVLLIVENLVKNALQATPRGRAVRVSLVPGGEGVVCRVRDEGPGFPEHLRAKLFLPCRSTQGGCGLGLAISQQLARQLGAALALERTSPGGCVFALVLPARLFEVEEMDASVTAHS